MTNIEELFAELVKDDYIEAGAVFHNQNDGKYWLCINAYYDNDWKSAELCGRSYSIEDVVAQSAIKSKLKGTDTYDTFKVAKIMKSPEDNFHNNLFSFRKEIHYPTDKFLTDIVDKILVKSYTVSKEDLSDFIESEKQYREAYKDMDKVMDCFKANHEISEMKERIMEDMQINSITTDPNAYTIRPINPNKTVSTDDNFTKVINFDNTAAKKEEKLFNEAMQNDTIVGIAENKETRLDPYVAREYSEDIVPSYELFTSAGHNVFRTTMYSYPPQDIKVKYFVDGLAPLKSNDDKSNWIDLRSADDVDMKKGEFKLIPLGVAMEIPKGFEAHIVPRSSTYKNYHIIQTNHVGIIDHAYCGDNDQWYMPAIAMEDTHISKNDRICQFRIIQNQPHITFITVDNLGNKDRGGLGSTGKQ